MVVEELYCTKGRSSSTDDKVEMVAFKVTNSSAETFKALTVHKSVLKQYTNLLVKVDENNELSSSRLQR